MIIQKLLGNVIGKGNQVEGNTLAMLLYKFLKHNKKETLLRQLK